MLKYIIQSNLFTTAGMYRMQWCTGMTALAASVHLSGFQPICIQQLSQRLENPFYVNGYIWYFFCYFNKGDNFYYFLFVSCTPGTFWKGVCSKRKEFAPLGPFWKVVCSTRKEFAQKGSQFFSFRVDPFSEERQNNTDKVAAPESIPDSLKSRPTLLSWLLSHCSQASDDHTNNSTVIVNSNKSTPQHDTPQLEPIS